MSEADLYGWDATNKKWVKLLANEDGKLIIDPSEIFENDPTNDEHGKAPDSDWAYEHAANASAHHARYTDGEAVASFGNRTATITAGTYDDYDVSAVSVLYLNTAAGTINLRGLSGGVAGQFIYCLKTSWSNEVNVLSGYSGVPAGDRIYTSNNATNDIKANINGAFVLYHSATAWVVTGFIFTNPKDIFEASPTNGQLAKGPNSDWAYDHLNNASAHHTKYTDAEAMNARYNNKVTLTTGIYTIQSVSGKGMILCDTSLGDITLKGLDGGVTGQLIHVVKYDDQNILSVIHNSGDAAAGDKIFTYNSSDDSVPGSTRGSFWLYYDGTQWITSRHLNI